MKSILSFSRNALIIGGLMLFAVQAHAMKAPDQVVKETVDSMVSKLQSNRAAYTADNKALYGMLEETLIPALNVTRMADLILGREVATSATPAQKKAFIKEFKAFLLQSYATGLLNATGEEKVIYEPVNMKPGADRVKVKATLISSDGASYPIVLSMSNKDDTQWRAYNMEVVGINVIRTYKASFAATLQQEGIDGLIANLRAKNNT
ncbi:MlaC/ttg2D family ABC transporter substrate-binding protein [Arenicella xantha]|uniref:Phospholipid transport system substrate-binding protein n=1 Tax=Arenicella xantha TaxID=644221 RepID=A0A395JHP6_9GAMM|nr:ABC transporter substrate-binding protein [Arenicella xantha]RBP49660.1 phospholipid transport system substrate-binding protein [Arenicella xantha]